MLCSRSRFVSALSALSRQNGRAMIGESSYLYGVVAQGCHMRPRIQCLVSWYGADQELRNRAMDLGDQIDGQREDNKTRWR